MRWLDYLKDEAEDIADGVAGAVGGAVSAVTPDIIERNAVNLVNNPVINSAARIFGPAQTAVNAVNFVGNPTAGNLIAAADPRNMTPGRPVRGTNPLGIAQQAADVTRYLGRAAVTTPGYLANQWSPQVIDALNRINGVTDIGGIGRAALAIGDPYLQVANRPVQDLHIRNGADAYAIAKSGGQRPADANTPFNLVADWAEQNPQEWPAIIDVYENGYDHDQDGRPDFFGAEAVWEYFIGLQNRATRVGAEIVNDPWNATLGVASLGRGIAAGAQAGSRAAQLGQGMQRVARAADTVGDLPLRAIGAAGRAAHVPQAAGAVARAMPWGLGRETESSIAGRLSADVGDTLGAVGEAIEGGLSTPRGVAQWAVPQTGTGKYEVVTISAEPNRGAAYIVDPQGNPLPGQNHSGKGKGVAKRLRDVADEYNVKGGPEGASSSPLPANPRYRLPGYGESAAPDTNSMTLVPEAQPAITPDTVPENMVGVTDVDGNVRTEPLPEPDVDPVDPYDVSTPLDFQQDRAARREAINAGMSFNAPNINDARLTSIAESLRADRPDAHAAFFRDIGLNPRTGEPIPGSAAARVAEIDATMPRTQDFAQKAMRQRINAMQFVVDVEAPAFQRHFGVKAKPPLSVQARSANPDTLARNVRNNQAGDAVRSQAIGDLVTRAVLDADGPAWRALSDLTQDFPWIADELPEVARLADAARSFDVEITDRFSLAGPQQAELPLDAPPARTVDAAPPDPYAGIDDEQLQLYLRLRSEDEAALDLATDPRDRAQLERHLDESNQQIIEAVMRHADRLSPDQADAIALDLAERGYHGAADTVDWQNQRGSTPFPEEAVDDLPLDGTTPVDVDGTTPFPDEDLVPPSGPTTPMGEGTYTRPIDPGTQSFLETLYNDGIIGNEEFDLLSRPLPNMDAPLIDEFIDRMRNGMTANEAVSDLQRAIMGSGQEPSRLKRALHKLDRYQTFTRQAMQHNILNGLPGGIGDLLGNSMHLWQTGQTEAAMRLFSPRQLWLAFSATANRRAAGRGGSRGVAREFTRETNDLLAGFDKELPESILGHAALNDARFGDDDLILSKATKGKSGATRTAASVIQSSWAQDFRKGIDANSRGVLTTQVLDDLLDPAVDRFKAQLSRQGLAADQTLDAIRRHATDARAPEAWNARGGARTMRSFSPEDVYAITGNEQLTRAWRSEVNGLYKEAGKVARETFFAGAKRYGIDDVLSKTFFFHFWQSRALGLQARSMIRSPRVLGGYYRMIQGAMNEAERNGYPDTFRGLTHYMGDTTAGFYGLFNPVGFLVPAMMFSDLGAQQGESWLNRVTGILPVTPMVNGALAALGVLDSVPNMTGTQRIQNYVTDVVNWGNAHGFDFALGGVIADPVQAWTQRIFEQINAGVQALGVPKAQRYEPYETKNGRIDTIQSVVYHEAEAEWGPADQWTNAQWDEIQDAMIAVETGGRGNDRAEQAIRDWNDANMRNRFVGLITPQGSVLRYGPREVARNDRDDTPGVSTDGELQRQIITASPESRAILIGQQQRDNLGTDRQRYFWETNNLILYGVDELPENQLNNYIDVGGQRITAMQLRGMDEDQRRLVANAYVAEHGGTQELQQYRDLRNQFIANNPSLANYREYTDFIRDYQNGGTTGFREWAATVSPEFKRRQEIVRDRFKGFGHSGAALTEELNDWARSLDAFTAFRGEKGSRYDATPLDGASPARDAQGMLRQASDGGFGSGRSSGGGLAASIRRDIAEYEEEAAAYEGTPGMPGLWGQAQENMYGAAPELSAATKRYLVWAQRQPAGADTSPEAYQAYVDTRSV